MFQPVLPTGGIAGWRFLERTLDAQREAFASSAVSQRSIDHFRDRIGEVRTAEDLVGDRRLREVALAAFGLEDDIDNLFFVRKILEDGTRDSDALANKLSDRRYRDFAEAFAFDDPVAPNTVLPGFADRTIARFTERSFEAAVGDVDDSMRVALNGRREMAEIGANAQSNDAKWFTIMGTPPLRTLMEGALGLSPSFGAVDIDRQLSEFKARAKAAFGTSDVAELARDDTLSRVIDLYLVRTAAAGGGLGGGPASPALTILRGF